MPTLKDFRDASDNFHQGIARSAHAALKAFGQTLMITGQDLAADEATAEPDKIAADAIVGAAKAHVQFREGALNAASKAVRKLRGEPDEDEEPKKSTVAITSSQSQKAKARPKVSSPKATRQPAKARKRTT